MRRERDGDERDRNHCGPGDDGCFSVHIGPRVVT
jgi:hypothetical protein